MRAGAAHFSDMLTIVKRILAAVAVVFSGWSCSDSKQFVGTYDVVRPAIGKPADMPPGQRMVMEVKKDGTWYMRDFLIGFDGTWSYAKGELSLVTTMGPAGKLAKPDVIVLHPSPDHKKLVIIRPKAYVGKLEYLWNPKAFQEWNDRVTKAMDEANRTFKKRKG